jgi:hypothetical protein
MDEWKREKRQQNFFCSRVHFSEVRRDEWRLTGDKSLFILKKKNVTPSI